MIEDQKQIIGLQREARCHALEVPLATLARRCAPVWVDPVETRKRAWAPPITRVFAVGAIRRPSKRVRIIPEPPRGRSSGLSH